MNPVTLLDIGMADDGHRAPYIAFLSKLFELQRMGFSRRAVFSRNPVLVPMIEESLVIYTITALIRSLLGRATVGLLFRPKPTLDGGSVRLWVKYQVLRGLRRLPLVRTLTIVPFTVEPRFARIAAGWIHDPQLWDLEDADSLTRSVAQDAVVSRIRNMADGRSICIALGRQDASKGFDRFADLYTKHAALRQCMLLAFGGKVSPSLAQRSAAFTAVGGLAWDRFISDDELLALYATADLVWCAYAPDYDQASGIMGRAVQLGIPVVVRRGSLLHRFCASEQIPHIAVQDVNDWALLTCLPPREDRAATTARKNRMRTESLRRLHIALGFAE